MKVYGIKNCNSVKKAVKFLKENSIPFEFVDFKETKPTKEKIKEWTEKSDIKKLFNSRSTTYKNLKLKELNLDDEAKIEWMAKEPLLIKRPVIEYKEKVLVGFDEQTYKKELL